MTLRYLRSAALAWRLCPGRMSRFPEPKSLLGREVERARRGGGGVRAVDEAVDRRVAQDEQRRLRVADEQAPDGLVLLGAEGRRIDHGLALSQLAVAVVEREQREAEDDDDADEEEALRPLGEAGGPRVDRPGVV